jgi:hypothetical protein
MARIIKAHGSITEYRPKNGDTFALEELQTIVGGYIEVVRTRTGELLIVNEDGLSLQLPFNSLASSYYGGSIVGDVVICTPDEID